MVDLADQMQSIYEYLDSQVSLAGQKWKDSVYERFDKTDIQNLRDHLETFLKGTGRLSMSGPGLIDILNNIEDYSTELSNMSGTPFSIQNLEKEGNEYVTIDEPLVKWDGKVKDKFLDTRYDREITEETIDIVQERWKGFRRKY